jgi:magnesium-transporting ATPase (P-type)
VKELRITEGIGQINKINQTRFKKLVGKAEIQEIQSKDIKVGDLMLIEEDATFPADIVLLKSSNGANAFIQTSSLDGEKNYKKRTIPTNFDEYVKPFEEQDFHLVGRCVVESPTVDLYSFNGKMIIGNEQFALKVKQLLLKGANLKNTHWIIGVVVYTGRDSKLMMNSQKSRIKQSRVEKQLNIVIFLILAIQLCICLALSIIMAVSDSLDDTNQDYYLGSGNSDESPVINFFSYFLLLNTMIPISLVVTLEIIKVLQCISVIWDSEMFSVEDNAGCNVSSTTINEELGQVKYLFSDKTGTLTQNIMEFKAI